MQSLSVHIWVLPAKLPSPKWNKTSCQQHSAGLHKGRGHVFCTDSSHPSAAGKELQLLLTAMSCNSSFCPQWPETLKSLEMPKITLLACLLSHKVAHRQLSPLEHTEQNTTLLSGPTESLTSSTLREKEEGRAKRWGHGGMEKQSLHRCWKKTTQQMKGVKGKTIPREEKKG